MKITAVQRPFVLTFLATNTSYPLSAADTQTLLDNALVVSATRTRVVVAGHNTPDPKQRAIVRPATLGGGPAFIVTR